jgi:hypothetical protein
MWFGSSLRVGAWGFGVASRISGAASGCSVLHIGQVKQNALSDSHQLRGAE